MKRRIITIGREFGSGGRELGRRISEKLQLAYYDREIVTEIAKRTSLSEEYVDRITSDRPFVSYPIHIGMSFYDAPDYALERYFGVYAEQHRLLEELSVKSDCVIVGRCADYILREKNPFRIFVYADMESKLKRCRERSPENENLSDFKMKRNIRSITTISANGNGVRVIIAICSSIHREKISGKFPRQLPTISKVIFLTDKGLCGYSVCEATSGVYFMPYSQP